MVVSASELARLVVAVSVVPLLAYVAPRLRMERAIIPWFSTVVGAIYLSYVVTILEGLFAEQAMNAVQHLLLGVAGVAAIGMSWLTRNDVIARRSRR